MQTFRKAKCGSSSRDVLGMPGPPGRSLAQIAEARQRMHACFVALRGAPAMLTSDCYGWCRLFLVRDLDVRRSFDNWRKMLGLDKALRLREDGTVEGETLEIGIESEGKGGGEGEGEGKGKGKGKGRGDGEGEGEGEGTGKGSSGSGSGSGSGSSRGKEDAGELPDPEDFKHIAISPGDASRRALADGEGDSEEISEEVAAQKRAKWLRQLKRIGMTEHDALKYEKYTSSVKSEIRELRVILEVA